MVNIYGKGRDYFSVDKIFKMLYPIIITKERLHYEN